MDEETYMIIRFFQGDHGAETIATGLTLEEAQEWCQDKESSSSTATSPEAQRRTKKHGPWFDGYEQE